MQEIFHRTSIRTFHDQPVEHEKIELLLRAGLQAPTAANQQSWHFYVVTNKDKLTQLSITSPYAKPVEKAPLAIVVAYEKDSRVPDYNDIDCAIATENIMLEADSLGLGSVMLGIAPIKERMQAVNDVLTLPKTQNAFTIIAIGYPVSVKPQQDRYNAEKIHYVD